jgi:hypothetical protein
MSNYDDNLKKCFDKMQFNSVWKKDSKYVKYRMLVAKTKGCLFEKAWIEYLKENSTDIEKSNDPDYDFKENGIKKEVKMSSIGKDGKSFTFFQIRHFQKYERIVFICVYPDEIKVFEIDKNDFLIYLKDHPDEVIWPGGKEKKKRLNRNIEKNDIYHWVKKEFNNWPKGTQQIL